MRSRSLSYRNVNPFLWPDRESPAYFTLIRTRSGSRYKYSPDPGSAQELCKVFPVAGLWSQYIFTGAGTAGSEPQLVLEPLLFSLSFIPVHHSSYSAPS